MRERRLARLKRGAFWKEKRLRPVFTTRAVPVAKVLAAPVIGVDQGSRVLKVDVRGMRKHSDMYTVGMDPQG